MSPNVATKALNATRLVASDRVALRAKIHVKSVMARLKLRNRLSRTPITGDGAAVVSLTSFGHRIATAFATIESIGKGRVRPRRVILWLDDEAVVADPPSHLLRLVRRGLEIRHCEDLGPHKKQYPFARDNPDATEPLVAADDDVLYPSWWLAELLDAHRSRPDDIACVRAATIAFDDTGCTAPYVQWPARDTTASSFVALAIGVSGILYPPAMLAALRAEGEAFRDAAPYGSDIWVSAVAVRAGIRTWQIRRTSDDFPQVRVRNADRGELRSS
jgi:hypothetical protein